MRYVRKAILVIGAALSLALWVAMVWYGIAGFQWSLGYILGCAFVGFFGFILGLLPIAGAMKLVEALEGGG